MPDQPRKKNPAAVALGKRGKGKPRTFTEEQKANLTTRLANARKRRWPKKSATSADDAP